MFDYSELERIVERNHGELIQWEYTSNGFWFTVSYKDRDYNLHLDSVLGLEVDLEEADAIITYHKSEVTERIEDDYTVEHEFEIMF